MQYTPHYNLITVEGNDVVNPLVQMNPNFTGIDAAMFANKQATVGSATELTSGTVHAITRANTDSNYFRFTATSNWTAGDSMTIDGINVSVFLTDGTVPGTGSYVINSEVFGIISGTRVTLMLTNPIVQLPATDVTFDPTGTSINPSATNADAALRDVASKIQGVQRLSGVVTVTGVSGDWVESTITFATPFKTTPIISIMQFEKGSATTWPMPMIRNNTNTGFTFGWYSVAGAKEILWTAFGEV